MSASTSSILCEVLKTSVQEAETLKCQSVDWSKIGGLTGLITILKKGIPSYITLYEEYNIKTEHEYDHQSLYGIVLFNVLGQKLLETMKHVRVLDIGCGTSQHFTNMFRDTTLCSKETCTYVSIDKDTNVADVIENSCCTSNNITCNQSESFYEARRKQLHPKRLEWIREHVTHTHITMDVFTDNVEQHMSSLKAVQTFNVVILDIEPHGKEWEVYHSFLPYLEQDHVVILKCIGNMNLYASSMVYTFMDNVKEHDGLELVEYIGWIWERDNIQLTYEKSFMMMNIYPRDVVCVIRKSKTSKQFNQD